MATKSLDQFLAETGRQSTLDELGRSGGLDQARSDFSAGRGAFSTSSSSFSSQQPSNFDFKASIQEAIKMQREAVQPAIESLRASIPEVQQKYQTQSEQIESKIEPLKERYSNLLADIKGQSKTREEAQTRVTSAEMAKRGIVGSSTLAQQQIQSAVDPIRSATQTATKDVGLAQEEGITNLNNIIANLTGQSVESVRGITNAIAQIQAGGAQTGITQGMQMGQFNVAQQQAQQQAATEQQRYDEQKAINERLYQQITLPAAQRAGRSSATVANPLDYLGTGTGQQIASYESTGYPIVDQLLGQGRWEEAEKLLLNP